MFAVVQVVKYQAKITLPLDKCTQVQFDVANRLVFGDSKTIKALEENL